MIQFLLAFVVGFFALNFASCRATTGNVSSAIILLVCALAIAGWGA